MRYFYLIISCIVLSSFGAKAQTDWNISYCDPTYNTGGDAFIGRFNKNLIGIVGINEKEVTKIGLDVFPNPGNDIFNVSFFSNEISKANIQILDVVGKEIQNTQLKVNPGLNQFNVNASGMSSGTYYINIQFDNNVGSAKLIKL